MVFGVVVCVVVGDWVVVGVFCFVIWVGVDLLFGFSMIYVLILVVSIIIVVVML